MLVMLISLLVFSKRIFGISILARCDSKSYNNFRESTTSFLCCVSTSSKGKKPFTIVEKLLLPAAKVLAETMIDKTDNKFNAVPLSNDTVSRRVDTMATDIVDQVVAKLTGSFASQLNQSTDVSGIAQLVGFVRYRNANDIAEHILFFKSMRGRSTRKDIFNVVDAFFAEKSLNWARCSSICTDAAASMTGTIKGFVTLAQEKNPNVKWTHCIIHREALKSKRMSPQLHDILNCRIKVINFIKSPPLNSRLFCLLCKKMEAKHTQRLLLHTEVRWFSRERILNSLFKLRTEVGMLCKEYNSPYSEIYENVGWLAKLCYLAEIFDKLDELNVGLQ